MKPESNIDAKLPTWARRWFTEHFNYKVAHGGRGAGAKSTTIARMLLLESADFPHRNLCARETMKSIEESVFSMLKEQITALNLKWFYKIEKSNITGLNGSRFFFSGLRVDPDHIKSYVGITRAWVEEAHNVTKESWKTLTPTVFRNEGAEIWVTFNPRKADDPTSEMFLENPRPNSLIVPLKASDNKYFSAAMREEMEYDYRKDPETAAHVWGGEYETKSEAQIFKGKCFVEPFTPQPEFVEWIGPFYGADFGFGKDPACFGKLWVKWPNLYVEHMKYGRGTELNDLFALFDTIPGAIVRVNTRDGVVLASQQNELRCDSSRPDTISLLRGQGLNAIAAKKGAGSVEEGIEFLKMFEKIIIAPGNEEFEKEGRLYHYKVDKTTGIISSSIVDAWNHGWDTARYAMEPMISADVKTTLIEYDSRTEHIPVSSALDKIDNEIGLGIFGGW